MANTKSVTFVLRSDYQSISDKVEACRNRNFRANKRTFVDIVKSIVNQMNDIQWPQSGETQATGSRLISSSSSCLPAVEEPIWASCRHKISRALHDCAEGPSVNAVVGVKSGRHAIAGNDQVPGAGCFRKLNRSANGLQQKTPRPFIQKRAPVRA